MLERYSRAAMRKIWSEENRFAAWLEVEILATEAWASIGEIPLKDTEKIRKKATFSIKRIKEIEQETKHDVVAFTRAISETLGEEKKWVHYGLTSTDVVDTAYGYILKQVNEILTADIHDFLGILQKQAHIYKDTIMMGRTHGVHAEPTTLGLKFALWYDEMQRNLKRFTLACQQIEVGKISGAVGTFANIPIEIESFVCQNLGLQPAPISTQTLQRDRHAFYLSTLALIGSTLDKIATEIRHLQRSEVREVEEYFAKGQKGSSAMPHKRNPIGSENISGCARVLRGYTIPGLEDIALWHERDISHSAVERIILPDATMLLDYMFNRMGKILDTLFVYPENMLNNMNKTLGLIFSQRVLLKLIDKGLSREQAYDLIQPLAMQAWEEQIPYRQLLEQNMMVTKLLKKEDLDDAFNPSYHVQNVDVIFARVFGQ